MTQLAVSRRSRARWSACLTVIAALAGCGREGDPGEPAFQVAFRVLADDGSPLPGATLATGERSFGETDAAGKLSVEVSGQEGKTFPIEVRCPDGYAAPGAPSPLRLARTRSVGEAGPQPIRMELVCTREARDAILVVHTEGVAGLPVQVGGEVAATTDDRGNAHVLVSVGRDTPSLSVSLDTSGQPGLRPQNPSRVFELDGRDAVLIFEQSFARPAPKRARRKPRAKPARHVPYRLD